MASTSGPPVPAEILRRSGFDHQVALFTPPAVPGSQTGRPQRALVRTRKARPSGVRRTHRAQHAPARIRRPARNRRPRPGTGPRLSMALALRQWQPRFGLGTTERAELIQIPRVHLTRHHLVAVRRRERTSRRSWSPASTRSRSTRTSGSATRPVPTRSRSTVPRWTVDRQGGERSRPWCSRCGTRTSTRAGGARAQPALPARPAARRHGDHPRARAGSASSTSQVYNGRRRSVSSIGDNNNIQGGGTYRRIPSCHRRCRSAGSGW